MIIHSTCIPLGGTIVAAIDLLVDRGVTSKQIKVVSSWNFSVFISQLFVQIDPTPIVLMMQVSAVAASPALQKLSNKFPG